jgi:hypothetical protein
MAFTGGVFGDDQRDPREIRSARRQEAIIFASIPTTNQGRAVAYLYRTYHMLSSDYMKITYIINI